MCGRWETGSPQTAQASDRAIWGPERTGFRQCADDGKGMGRCSVGSRTAGIKGPRVLAGLDALGRPVDGACGNDCEGETEPAGGDQAGDGAAVMLSRNSSAACCDHKAALRCGRFNDLAIDQNLAGDRLRRFMVALHGNIQEATRLSPERLFPVADPCYRGIKLLGVAGLVFIGQRNRDSRRVRRRDAIDNVVAGRLSFGWCRSRSRCSGDLRRLSRGLGAWLVAVCEYPDNDNSGNQYPDGPQGQSPISHVGISHTATPSDDMLTPTVHGGVLSW